MSTQLLMSNNSSTLSRPQIIASNTEMASSSTLSIGFTRKVDSVKCPYQADQQVKFLHLQAEIDSLLLQVQTLKQQRSIAGLSPLDPISGSNSNCADNSSSY